MVSLAIGESFDGNIVRHRGPARKPRDTQEQPLKDPFPSRPRIQSRNGHLVIEASQDKNIEFKTRGSRGSVTINGLKIDQLIAVTQAFGKLNQVDGLSQLRDLDGSSKGTVYEQSLRKLHGAANRISSLEKSVSDLEAQVSELITTTKKLTNQMARRKKQANDLSKKQTRIIATLKRNDCFDQDSGQPICKHGASCIDSYESFKCLCPSNYEGPTCELDVNECLQFRGTDLGCQNGAKCINFFGGFRCECPPQFHGVYCTEHHDDCALSSSRSLCGHGKCINLARTEANQARYECICDQGWTTDGKSPACIIDIDECAAGQMSNVTTIGQALASSTSYAYPCSQNPFVTCINLPGSFQCNPCPIGYTGNGRVCSDVDECQQNNGGCSTRPLVECINTPGSRRCGPCPPGYTGDGQTCVPVSICSTKINGGCHPLAKCVELTGASAVSRLCICEYPYFGSGIGASGCEMMQTSQLGPNSSSSNATVNPKDDCQPNPCLNGAQCYPTVISFECICQAGWSGRLCDEPPAVCGGQLYASRGSFAFPPGGSFVDLTKQIGLFKQQQSHPETPFQCIWSIAGTTPNQVLKLQLADLKNRLNPEKEVSLFLANLSSINPTCDESLKLFELLDPNSNTELESSAVSPQTSTVKPQVPKRRLVATFCMNLPQTSSISIFKKRIELKQIVQFPLDTNLAQLEYSLESGRPFSIEPGLHFSVNWTQIDPTCGGSYRSESGSISSPKFPDFYKAGIECRYLIQVPTGKRIRVQFGEISLLSSRQTLDDSQSNCADSLTILDGSFGSHRPVLFRQCGNNVTSSSVSANPIVSASSNIEIILDSNPDSTGPLTRSPKQRRGFYFTYASEPSETGCGGLFTTSSGSIKSSDYEFGSINSRGRNEDADVVTKSSIWERILEYMPHTTNYSNNQSAKIRAKSSSLIRTRCEYELRPADQLRDQHVSIDWIEMLGPDPPVFLSLRSQRIFSCVRGKLTIYDNSRPPFANLETARFTGNKSESSPDNELAVFCAGDRYSSREPMEDPSIFSRQLVSSGHSLLVVYESQRPSNDLQPKGFKLHYSTACTAIFRQPVGRLTMQLGGNIRECLYHILLPPNNSISLTFEPSTSDSLILPDGNCALESYFTDGAIEDSTRSLAQLESHIENMRLGTPPTNMDRRGSPSRSGISNEIQDTDDQGSSFKSDSVLSNETLDPFQWQHQGSSLAVDIKEFDLCRAPWLSFDSIWNHVSFLVRLRQPFTQADPSVEPLDGVGGRPNGASVALNIRYQAEFSCGGIISEPKSGNISISSHREISVLERYPITATKYEQLHRDMFKSQCAWILKAPLGQTIRLQFTVPDSEIQSRYIAWAKQQRLSNQTVEAPDCEQIYQESIELYEPSLNQRRNLCPIELTPSSTTSWTSQSNILYIRLNNETTSSKGNISIESPIRKPIKGMNLVAHYKFVPREFECTGKLIHDSGVIRSPNYPDYYPPGLDCTWIIQTNPGQQIRLNVTEFDLEGGYNACRADYLEIRNGPSKDSPLIGRFCGRELKSNVLISHSNFLLLHMKTDEVLSRQGFEIRYDAATTGCGGHLSGISGQIDSPNYPSPFGYSAKCEWVIEVSQGNKIDLVIQDLELNNLNTGMKDCDSPGLVKDYLEIFDATTWNGEPTNSLGRLCHQRQLKGSIKLVRSRGNKLLIKYFSQALDTSRGFRLTYETVCANIELKGFHGALESPGFSRSYEPNLRCGWILRAPLGNKLRLAITHLDIEDSRKTIKSPISSPKSDMSVQNTTNQSSISLCLEDSLELWRLPPSHSSIMDPIEPIEWKVNSIRYQLQPNSTDHLNYYELMRLSPTKSRKVPKKGKLLRSLCGESDSLRDEERVIEFDTNMVYISFATDHSVTGFGFRLEWQVIGCGGELQVQEDGSTVSYKEAPLTTGVNQTNSSKSYECIWFFKVAESGKRMEFMIDSDMRQTLDPQRDACQYSSLTVFDGFNHDDRVLMKNCDTKKNFQVVMTNNDVASVRFYSSAQHYFGHELRIVARPGYGLRCLKLEAPGNSNQFNKFDFISRSPTSVQSNSDGSQSEILGCNDFIYEDQGRLMIHVDELNIPASAGETATTVGIPDSATCEKRENFLSILVKQETSEYFCGKLNSGENELDSQVVEVKRPTTLILERSYSSIIFHARASAEPKWQLSWGSLCGYQMVVRRVRDFSTPNYPSLPNWPKDSKEDRITSSENVCLWTFEAEGRKDRLVEWLLDDSLFRSDSQTEKKQDDRLYFSLINFVESNRSSEDSPQTDCLRIFEGVNLNLRQRYFNLTEIDLKYQPKLKICSKSDLSHKSLTYASRGSSIQVMTSGLLRAKFRVHTYENYCGGEFHLSEGQFASPGYPNLYEPNLDCYYHLIGSPGSRFELKLLDLALLNDDSSENCDESDHLEIYQMSALKQIQTYSTGPFVFNINFASYQQSSTPNTPISSSKSKQRSRLLEIARQNRAFIKKSNTWGPSLANYDDIHQSRLVAKICGDGKPPKFDPNSLRGELLIRFRSFNGGQTIRSQKPTRGFLLDYKILYGGLIRLDVDSSQSSTGFIASPMFPTSFRANNTIVWTFEVAKPDSVILFDLVSLSLGSIHSTTCEDSLSIYDGLNPNSDLRLVELCGQLSFKIHGNQRTSTDYTTINLAQDPTIQSNLIKTVRTSKNIASVVYENTETSGQFLLRYRAIKLSELQTYINETTDSSTDSDQPLGNDEAMIQQNLIVPLSSNSSSRCSGTIVLDYKHQNASEASLESPGWPKEPSKSIECHWLITTDMKTTIRFSSDLISFGSSSSSLSINSNSCFDPKYLRTKRAYVTIHDGSSLLAPELTRFCLPSAPSQIQSSGRFMTVRFVFHAAQTNTPDDSSDPMQQSATQIDSRPKSFKGLVSLSPCGGQYHSATTLILNDRDQVTQNYSNNINCKYQIFAENLNQSVMLFWQRFELSSEPTNADCSIGDYVQVKQLIFGTSSYDMKQDSVTDDSAPVSYSVGRLLGRFCAGRPPQSKILDALSSGALIEFHTDEKNSAKGWQVLAMSHESEDSCNSHRHLTPEEPFARLNSPGWPNGFFGERDCFYQISAPPNQTIELNFIRLQRDQGLKGHCNDRLAYIADNEVGSMGRQQKLRAAFKAGESSPLLRQLVNEIPCDIRSHPSQLVNLNIYDWNHTIAISISETDYFALLSLAGDKPEKLTIKTESNSLLLNYRASNLGTGFGFVALVRTSDEKQFKCGGKINQTNNYIESASFGMESKESEGYIQCSWLIREPASWSAMHGNYMNLNYERYQGLTDFYVGHFEPSFIVFQVLEIPPIIADRSALEEIVFGAMMSSTVYDEIDRRLDETCGLNRMILRSFMHGPTEGCGNLTSITPIWLPLKSMSTELILRTKNLKSPSKGIYRGVRGYYHRSRCQNIERLKIEGLRIRSSNLANSSYVPSICWWRVELNGGDFELWFDQLNFRAPKNRPTQKNTTKDNRTSVEICNLETWPDLDYLEVRASDAPDSPVLERFCYLNEDEAKKGFRVLTNTDDLLAIYFVAGLDRLSRGFKEFEASKTNVTFGFDLRIVQAGNSSDFCRYHSGYNLPSMLINSDRDFLPSSWDFLQNSVMYPKNVHCRVVLRQQRESRFNFSFFGLFDVESSPGCKNDYVQLENLDPNPGQSNITSLIGRWCGRNRIDGYFLSNSSRVRITFHSNSNIEGRGFRLAYREFPPANRTGSGLFAL